MLRFFLPINKAQCKILDKKAGIFDNFEVILAVFDY